VPLRGDGIHTEPTAVIKNYKWAKGYNPECNVYLSYDAERLYIGFEIFEADAIKKAKYVKDGQPVYKDSAVEFFFKPFIDDARYLNFEFNANCAAILGLGEKKNCRISLIEKYKSRLNARVFSDASKWILDFQIPYKLIGEIYGRSFEPKSQTVKANFYKCGDETESPHYGMVFDINSEYPDFHLPDFFGRLIF
jgi:hypothetical protein